MLFARLHKLRSIRTPQVLSAFLLRFDAPSINQSVSQSISQSISPVITIILQLQSRHCLLLKLLTTPWISQNRHIFMRFIWDENWCERYDFINLKIKMDSAKRPNTITSMKIFVSYRFVSPRSCWFWQKASKMNKKNKKNEDNNIGNTHRRYISSQVYKRNFWLNFFFGACSGIKWLWRPSVRGNRSSLFRFSEFPHTHTLAKAPSTQIRTPSPLKSAHFTFNLVPRLPKLFSFLFAFFWTNQLFFSFSLSFINVSEYT